MEDDRATQILGSTNNKLTRKLTILPDVYQTRVKYLQHVSCISSNEYRSFDHPAAATARHVFVVHMAHGKGRTVQPILGTCIRLIARLKLLAMVMIA